MKRESVNTKKDKNIELCKMLSTAAVSAALISWFTTANGLHAYVFKHIWQAYVISAALQGALFSLSIRGVELFFCFNNRWKKASLIFVWICLLSASSIFSYVYISGDVYTEVLLREDAQRILNTYCLEKNFQLLDDSDELLFGENGIRNMMDEYIKSLTMIENGIEFSTEDTKIIEMLKESINNYMEETPTDDFEYVDTTLLGVYFQKIVDKKYTDNDIKALLNEADSIIETINIRIEELQNEQETKKAEHAQMSERLKNFKDTSSIAYFERNEELQKIEGYSTNLKEEIEKLNNEREDIRQVITGIEGIEGSKEKSLYEEVLHITTEMNAENINVNKVVEISDNIYNILLKDGTQTNGEKITEYVKFKDNLKKYESIINSQKAVENEIKILYNFTENSEGSFELIETLEQQEKSVTSSNLVRDEISEETNFKKLNLDEGTWNDYWQNRLNSLRNSVQMLQSGGLEPQKLNELLETIEVRERLYLSDLNDFERAFSLLFGKEPKHPYKTLLIFSFCFSFGLDLFSVLMSCLLYIFKTKQFIVISK